MHSEDAGNFEDKFLQVHNKYQEMWKWDVKTVCDKYTVKYE